MFDVPLRQILAADRTADLRGAGTPRNRRVPLSLDPPIIVGAARIGGFGLRRPRG